MKEPEYVSTESSGRDTQEKDKATEIQMQELRNHCFKVIKELQTLVNNKGRSLELLVGGQELLTQAVVEQKEDLLVGTDMDSDIESSLFGFQLPTEKEKFNQEHGEVRERVRNILPCS